MLGTDCPLRRTRRCAGFVWSRASSDAEPHRFRPWPADWLEFRGRDPPTGTVLLSYPELAKFQPVTQGPGRARPEWSLLYCGAPGPPKQVEIAGETVPAQELPGRAEAALWGPVNFASDNTAAIAPEILAAMARASDGFALGYGNDDLTRKVERRIAEIFEQDVAVFLVPTGTAANALALAHVTPPWGGVLCHAQSPHHDRRMRRAGILRRRA